MLHKFSKGRESVFITDHKFHVNSNSNKFKLEKFSTVFKSITKNQENHEISRKSMIISIIFQNHTINTIIVNH